MRHKFGRGPERKLKRCAHTLNMPNKQKPQKYTDEDESTSAGKKKKKSYNVTDAAEKVSFVSISSPEVVIVK